MLEKKSLGLNSEIFFNTLCGCVCVSSIDLYFW